MREKWPILLMKLPQNAGQKHLSAVSLWYDLIFFLDRKATVRSETITASQAIHRTNKQMLHAVLHLSRVLVYPERRKN